jgi:hypothetical protein
MSRLSAAVGENCGRKSDIDGGERKIFRKIYLY